MAPHRRPIHVTVKTSGGENPHHCNLKTLITDYRFFFGFYWNKSKLFASQDEHLVNLRSFVAVSCKCSFHHFCLFNSVHLLWSEVCLGFYRTFLIFVKCFSQVSVTMLTVVDSVMLFCIMTFPVTEFGLVASVRWGTRKNFDLQERFLTSHLLSLLHINNGLGVICLV